MKRILIPTLLLVLAVSGSAFAKKLDTSSPSVQLLQTLTEEGRQIRQNDPLIEKADVEADKVRVKCLKKIYNESLIIPDKNTKEIPIDEQSGIFE